MAKVLFDIINTTRTSVLFKICDTEDKENGDVASLVGIDGGYIRCYEAGGPMIELTPKTGSTNLKRL